MPGSERGNAVGEHDQDGRSSGWQWPVRPSAEGTRSLLPAVVWPALFLFYLAQPIVAAFNSPHSPGFRVAVVTVTVVYGAGYLAAIAIGMRVRSRLFRITAVAALFAMPVVLALFGGSDLLVYWTYAIVAALVLLPRNVGALIGLASAVSLLVVSTIETGNPHWDNAMLLVVMTMAMFGFTALIRTVAELRAARDRVADLAVAEERARMSRDLHDVLGHSLTTITVKAGLARRVLESGADTGRAVAEITDVELLSRQALAEVRLTVSGRRTASLPAELAGARAALRAAQISADLPYAVDDVPVSLQEPFAYVLREGVTNVIRHSGASRCEVRLGETWIEIRDNGLAPGTAAADRGNGLTGLAERLAPLGGVLDAGTAEDGGFRLRATVSATREPA
ncbi:sensor histidine kinase [Actinophytocola sp.]|uniref:sensor histidine kinase n=1 Tax=Actinophytocola sp. TaxID=1872138 RepID=UPI002D7E73D1|nr:histidine kinase [Actinophytocola sp.]HET9140309.1 histidine kinase [Actinophytocola sp.]